MNRRTMGMLAGIAIALVAVVYVKSDPRSGTDELSPTVTDSGSHGGKSGARDDRRTAGGHSLVRISDLLDAGWKVTADRVGRMAAEGKVRR